MSGWRGEGEKKVIVVSCSLLAASFVDLFPLTKRLKKVSPNSA